MSFTRSSLPLRHLHSLSRSIHSSPAAALPPAAARRVPVPSKATARSTISSTPSAPVNSKAEDIPPPIDDFDFDSADSPPARAAPTPKVVRGASSPPLSSIPPDGYKPLASVGGIPGEQNVTDWTTSFAGLSDKPFSRDIAEVLLKPIGTEDIEIKPDGLIYLPEIKYRRILNLAFGPGGWGLAPRGETHITDRIVSREWGLVCLGRLVSVARGEQEYFDVSGIPTATEACKSNALMRCCKDLGIASELWDPVFIREFKDKNCVEVFVEHATTKKKKKLYRKRNAAKFTYPWVEGK